MSRSTARRILSTSQCRSCHQRVELIEASMLCTPCHQMRHLFPNGEVNRRRRGPAFITRAMIQTIPPPYATECVALSDKQLHAHYFVGGCDWYVAELSSSDGDAFGYADLGHGEWGYFNLVEMERIITASGMVVERELDFRPSQRGS